MADELPEKIEVLLRLLASSHGGPDVRWANERDIRRIARLATEEATRELRERLERAQGALRAHANSADVLKGFEAPVPTPEQWGRIQPLVSRLRDQLQAHALAIREAKESAHD